MADFGGLEGLENLHRDLLAYSEARLPHVERLWTQLEAHIEEFRHLLEKKPRNEQSRKSLETGKLRIQDEEYSVNQEFQHGTLELADTLNLDELESAQIFLEAQSDTQRLGRPVLECAIIRFHQTRTYILHCFRLLLQLQAEVDGEAADSEFANGVRDNFRLVVSEVLQVQESSSNGAKFVNKCFALMGEIKTWLQGLTDRISGAAVLGNGGPEFNEIIEYQRISLTGQHESLGMILRYLVKENHASSPEFEHVLEVLKRADKYDNLLVHYIPATAAFITSFGSLQGSRSLSEARTMNQKITGLKDQGHWTLHYVHAAVSAWWLAEYTGIYLDNPIASPLAGVDLEEESNLRSKQFTDALRDGAFDFILSLAEDVKPIDSQDVARHDLRQWLRRKAPPLLADTIPFSDFFEAVLMEDLESFIDAFITNMPDVLRKLRLEEDEQRQLSQTREHDLDLERFLLIISLSFESRPEAAHVFWSDPDNNLAGFLNWASRRASTPLMSAFCDMLQALSGTEEYATAAHKFLLDEGVASSGKLRKSHSLSWSRIIKELQFFYSKISDRPAPHQTIYRGGKHTNEQVETEPESIMMLGNHLRLITRLCSQSSMAREFLLKNSEFNITDLLLQLASCRIPSRLRACVFSALRSLLTDKTKEISDFMWNALDHWISGGYSSVVQVSKGSVQLVPDSWAMGGIFEEIGSGFDEPNAFIELLCALVSPCGTETELDGSLPFPETLGTSSRTPGIDPYIDFAVGQILGGKTPEPNESTSSRRLCLTSLNFIATCLGTFNEDLVKFANSSGIMIDSAIKTSDLATYARLHPFSRVMEWMFNDKVMAALFSATHQSRKDAAGSFSPDSILVQCLLRATQVITLVMQLQATYFDIVRPIIKLQPTQRRAPVANAAFASFEDGVLNNLDLIVDIGSHCESGHPDLIIASLSLLKLFSTAPKLATPSMGLGGRRERNKIIAKLEVDEHAEDLARSLLNELESHIEIPSNLEIELNLDLTIGPRSSAYIIKMHILEFLYSCLEAGSNRPTIAHLLLGFQCQVDSLDVNQGSHFADGSSLFHAVMELAMHCPISEESGAMSSWLISLKSKALIILRFLWRSPLSSDIVMQELRRNSFLTHMVLNETVVSPETVWDGRTIEDDEFVVTSSSSCLSSFVNHRAMVFQYVASELRQVERSSIHSLKLQISSALLGSTTVSGNQQVQNATIFDFSDFMELEVRGFITSPLLFYLKDIDFSTCEEVSGNGISIYNPRIAKELILLRRNELENLSQLRNVESFDIEEQELLMCITVDNQSKQQSASRLEALTAWSQVMVMMINAGGLEGTNKLRVILEAVLVIQSKLEKHSTQNLGEALQLAQLAKFLLFSINFDSASFRKDDVGHMANDRLFQLFSVSLRAIQSPIGNAALKETLYTICYRYLAGISEVLKGSSILRKDNVQTIKTAGERFLAIVCDDAYAGEQTCRISALLLLGSLITLAKQEDSKYIVEGLVRLNFLGLVVDSLKHILDELHELQPEDIDMHVAYHNSKLALLLQVSQTRFGATAVFNAGFFQAIKESRIFSTDPDIGIDAEDPGAVKRHYELLLSIMRIINAAVLSRGSQNEQTLSLARSFLSENRVSVLTVFKRSAKLGIAEDTPLDECIDDLAESYMLLISMSGFLDFDDQAVQSKQLSFKAFT